jgi:replicative DNA helicase
VPHLAFKLQILPWRPISDIGRGGGVSGADSTGIAGLDEVLGGRLPQGHLYLIEGASGAGKTTVGLQFLLEGQRRGERTLWITLSETERELHVHKMRGIAFHDGFHDFAIETGASRSSPA